jgi:hypothetical protein
MDPFGPGLVRARRQEIISPASFEAANAIWAGLEKSRWQYNRHFLGTELEGLRNKKINGGQACKPDSVRRANCNARATQ